MLESSEWGCWGKNKLSSENGVVSKKFTPDLNNLVSKLIHRHQASAPNVGPCTPLKRKKHVLIVEKQRWSKRKSEMALT